MKGIVVEINNKDAVILSDDGLFKKIENRNYEIGQTLQISDSRNAGLKQFVLKPVISSKLMAGAARIAAVLAVGTIGAFAWYTPTDYISLDVNPSIEYSVNIFDRILKVHAVNEDGEEILSGLKLKNKNIGEGLKVTLDELIAEGYLAGDPDSGVVIATSSDKQKEAEQLASELKQEVETFLDTKEDVTAEVDAGAASPQKVQEARSMGVTPGKLHLVEKLQASTTGAIETEQWLTKPVKDINKEIKKNRETSGRNPHDAAESAYNSSWNWNQGGDADQNRNGNKDNAAWDKNTYQTWNRNQNNDKDEDEDSDKDQDRDQDKNGDNSGWNRDQNQGQDQNRDRSQFTTPGQIKATLPAMTIYQNPKQNQDQKQDKKQEQKDKKQDPDQDRNQSQKWNKDRGGENWEQDWSQNWNQPENQNQNWNQPENQNQITPGGIGSDGYGGWNGSWSKSGSRNEDDNDKDDDEDDGGKDDEKRLDGFRKSKDND